MTPRFIHELMCHCRWELRTSSATGYALEGARYRIAIFYSLETSQGAYTPLNCNTLTCHGRLWETISDGATAGRGELADFKVRVKGWAEDCSKVKTFDAKWGDPVSEGTFEIEHLAEGFTVEDLEHHFMMARLQAPGNISA